MFTLIGSLILILALLEACVRLYLPQPFSLKIPLENLNTGTSPRIKKRLKTDEFLIDNQINNLGFHDTEHNTGPHPGIFRIIVLGDSFAFAEHFPLNDIWPKQLEAILRSGLNKEIEVINLGIKGAGTGWELAVFEKLGVLYEPDLVLLTFDLGSDFFNNHPGLENKLDKPFFKVKNGSVILADGKNTEVYLRGIWLPLWRLSHLYRYCHRSLYKISRGSKILRKEIPIKFEQYLTSPPNEWPESQAYTKIFLKNIQDVTNKNKSRLIVAIIPDKYQIYNEYWDGLEQKYPAMLNQNWDMAAPRKNLIAILKGLNIHFIDLTASFQENASRGEILYFIKDVHWNLAGNTLAAQIIAEQIAGLTE